MDHNPYLAPWRMPAPNTAAGKGVIERPGAVANIVWQTRPAAPTPYESDLADALIACFEAGAEDLPALVDGLNARGLRTPDHRPWTVESFEREIARLGA
ncbi:recombinase-like helix-turn-helix domain-containing protein [Azospirillum sp. ST 5-10]|uniref:recombinase-like helix-turn-helix domain-containing protein n=1 Tax=unclassified Azospirillum TaxID=2630922 RepID=UPI003F4A6B39